MKKTIFILLFLGLSLALSCKKSKEAYTIEETSTLGEALKPIKSIQTLNKKFVTATNGLNYRDKPEGQVLGKFLYNTELSVIEYTSNEQEIIDNGKTITGTWVGVQNNKDTVYVFNAYLSNFKDVTQLLNENEYHIQVDDFFKDPWEENTETIVQELKNDTIVVKEIKLRDFVTITEVTQKDFETVYINNSKSKDRDLTKKDSMLTISCFNNKTIAFKDKQGEYDEDIEEYYYSTTFEEIDAHLIYMSGWEWGTTYLVNYKTCKTLKLDGYPIFNKDYSKMICFDSDLEDEAIYINSFDGFNVSKKYFFSFPITSNRVSIDRNEDFYIESVSEWNDGQQHKVSRQYFKFEFIK